MRVSPWRSQEMSLGAWGLSETQALGLEAAEKVTFTLFSLVLHWNYSPQTFHPDAICTINPLRAAGILEEATSTCKVDAAFTS